MSRTFYMKLAAMNIRKNSRTYFPYMLTCIGSIAMYYIMYALSRDPGLSEVFGGADLATILSFGTFVVAFFCVIFLFYTHSFLIKRRKKEFGLYNIMGMEKRHIAKVLAYETFYVAFICLVVGLLAGTLLSKLFYLVLLKIVKFQVPMDCKISFEAISAAVILFLVVFVLTFLNTLRQIHLSNPIQLLAEGKVGEREPKTKWLLTLIGVISLGIGYYIAVTTENPLSVIPLFLLAIILVMIGTYCLFTAGSIALLKLLKKNKRYYYQANHFTAVSGMIYRMKQNAIGLANICILSTGILLMISAAVSLYVGTEDMLRERYPSEISIQMREVSQEKVQRMETIVDKTCAGLGVKPLDTKTERAWDIVDEQDENTFYRIVLLSDYNKATGKNIELKSDEVLNGSLPEDTVRFGEREFKIKDRINDGEDVVSNNRYGAKTFYIVVPGLETISDILAELGDDLNHTEKLYYHYYFNTNADADLQKELTDAIQNAAESETASGNPLNYYMEGRESQRQGFDVLYGGLFFVGVFMGVMFLMVTVLIIYYKQVSEGYDDSERFIIMKKVGMSKKEVKKSIRSQVLTVFFIPVVMACIHMCFAFPIMIRLMALLNLTNVPLYMLASIATVLAFIIIYTIVYILTARVYYRIVNKS